MSEISLQHISKVFPNGTHALDDVNLDIIQGEFLVLVGPSGCGKTTLLRIISGLDQPTSGLLKINKKDATNLPSKDRDLAMVFQNYALYPHLTVQENMAFGLTAQKKEKAFIQKEISKVAEKLALSDLLERKPNQLSGGQKQRVALGRLLARNPSIHLLDEPLSNLDANLRTSMRSQLAELHREYKRTTLYVTHDQIEAMTLGQRLCVMNHGKIVQLGTPSEIYQKPQNQFVAQFFGFPNINLFSGKILKDTKKIEIAKGINFQFPDSINPPIEKVNLGIRPEDWVVTKEPFTNSLEAKIDRIENLGDSRILYLTLLDIQIIIKSSENNFKENQIYHICPNWKNVHWFDLDSGNRLSV